MKPVAPTVDITETGPETFTLAVTVDGRRFDCGTYLSRTQAQQAGRLFVQRKEAEATAQKGRPRRKAPKR